MHIFFFNVLLVFVILTLVIKDLSIFKQRIKSYSTAKFVNHIPFTYGDLCQMSHLSFLSYLGDLSYLGVLGDLDDLDDVGQLDGDVDLLHLRGTALVLI